MAMVGALYVQADGYSYLIFELTDGSKASVSTTLLSLSISGNTLTAGSQQFTLTNLNKMYFSTIDEATGIEQLTVDSIDDAAEIYDLQGKRVAKEQMRKGVYIIKTKQGTHKITMK